LRASTCNVATAYYFVLCLPSAVAISQVAMTPAWPPASELPQRRRRCVLMIRRFWTCAIVTTVSALVSAGFSVVGLFGPSSSGSFERYAASRSVALLIAVLCCVGFRSRDAIAVMALVMSLVQGFDGVIGILAHDPAKTYGPFAFAIINFAVLVWLLCSPEDRNVG
jgi:hypothetical protein